MSLLQALPYLAIGFSLGMVGFHVIYAWTAHAAREESRLAGDEPPAPPTRLGAKP